jgi:hypothetical protein
MAQQTAVEWLIEKIQSYQIEIDKYNRINIDVPKYMIEQAKAMEKEQIIIAYDRGYIDGYPDNGKVGLDYYKETYNK